MTKNRSNLTEPIQKRSALEELIRTNATETTLPPKKVFLEPGDILSGVYYIAEGRTSHYIIALDGSEKLLYTLTAGWFFGETPCYLEEPTGLFSKAETKTVLYKIPGDRYTQLMDTSKGFRDAILENYSKKMHILRHEVEDLVFNSCKDRLKCLFCSLADTSKLCEGQWYDLKIYYTQYELSTIVGSARVTITKSINELCSEGAIRLLNRNVQVNAKVYEKMIIDEE